MSASTSFVIQIANIFIEILGFNGEVSACLNGLRKLFRHHEVIQDSDVNHRIIVCPSSLFELPPDSSLKWAAPCLGVAGIKKRRRCILSNILIRHKEKAKYSGTCNVVCYRCVHNHVDYFIPEYGEWRIEHHAKERVTYIYSNQQSEMYDDLSSMLINVIGSQYGLYLIFASCVSIKEEALLFLGNGGSGKSTLSIELVKQGASYIGDDLVLLYLDGTKAMVGSLLFPIKYFANKNKTHKVRIEMTTLMPQPPTLNAPLKSMYFLQREDIKNSETYLKQIDGISMLEKMLMLTNKVNTNVDGHHFFNTLSSVCNTTPCYYLYYFDSKTIKPSFFFHNDKR